MNLTKRVGFLTGAAALVLTGGSFADTTSQETNQQLRARVADLESRLAAVEKGDNWLNEQRADEVRGLVRDVLADADTRASLLAQGMTAGYDNGAVIASADGNWMLRTNILMQQRFVLNTQDAGDGSVNPDDDRWGFENTRTKFILTGNVVSPDWFYRVDINVGSPDAVRAGDSRAGTQNAYLGYDYGNGWKVLLGSMKAPLLREELVEAQHQLAVERSNVNYIYTTGYVDGVALDYMGDQFHVTAALSDGLSSGQTVWSTPDTEFALTARVEWLAQGTWDQFTDFTSPNGDERGILVGGAIHYESLEDDPGTGLPDADIFILTVDGSFEFGGWNGFAAFIYTDLQDLLAAGVDTNALGLLFQGGYYLNDNWELFGRYEWSDFDTVGVEDLSIFTVGVNRYFAGHNAKWTTDISFGLDEIDADLTALGPVGATGAITGFRADNPGEDGQVVIRSQVQILF
ncbi:MAG: hypothetical protein IH830_00695 [Planctomycetes bacterium]|nr:hypothetical protein [Planctomycetota bacterium]